MWFLRSSQIFLFDTVSLRRNESIVPSHFGLENCNFSFSVGLSTRVTFIYIFICCIHDVTPEESSFKYEIYRNSLVIFERDATGLIRFNDLCLAKLKVLLPDTEIGSMDSKMVKLNCLTLGEL